MTLTLLFPFFKLLTYVPVAPWTVTFFSWANWLSGYSYGNSFNTKGWWEEVPISKVSGLIIHFYPVFSRCPVSHLSGPLHPHAGISQRGQLPWRWTFSLQRRCNFFLLAFHPFQRNFSRLRIWECAELFGIYHLVRMHAGKITPGPLQRWPTRTPRCVLLRTSQAGKEAQLPFSLLPFIPGDCSSVGRCCSRLEAYPRATGITWYPCWHLEPLQSLWSRLEA